MKRILIACTVMALAACVGKDENGDGIADGVVSPDSVQQVAPSTPVGTLSGQTTKIDGTALDGVKVTLVLGAKTLTTNSSAAGTFSFANIPAGGTGQLWFEKSGYAKVILTGSAPSGTSQLGGFPLNNGNGNLGQIGMAALSSTVQFRVVTANGAPTAGANATLDMNGAGYWTSSSGGSPVGRYTATVQVGADGLAKFENVPELLALSAAYRSFNTDGQVALAVQPFDVDGDQLADFRATVKSWGLITLFTEAPQPLVVLDPANAPNTLAIAGTNLKSFGVAANSPPFDNAVKGNDPISITFNQPINQVATARWVKVVAEDCKTDVGVTTTQVSPWTIQITPNGGWTLGAKYNVAVHVTGLDSADSKTFIGYAFGLDATQAKPVSSYALIAEKPSGSVASNIDLPLAPSITPGTERMWAVFDVPMKAIGSAEAFVQYNLDLDNNAGNLESCGETGNKFRQGWSMYADEPTDATDNKGLPANTFTCKVSGYTTRWNLAITSGYGCVYAPFPTTMPSTTSSKILFPNTTSSTDTYQSITGANVTGELSASSIQINVLIAP